MTNKDQSVNVAMAFPISSKEFLTAQELADQLQTTVSALASLRSRGGGPPFVHVGRTVSYPVVAVRVWALQQARTRTGGTRGD